MSLSSKRKPKLSSKSMTETPAPARTDGFPTYYPGTKPSLDEDKNTEPQDKRRRTKTQKAFEFKRRPYTKRAERWSHTKDAKLPIPSSLTSTPAPASASASASSSASSSLFSTATASTSTPTFAANPAFTPAPAPAPTPTPKTQSQHNTFESAAGPSRLVVKLTKPIANLSPSTDNTISKSPESDDPQDTPVEQGGLIEGSKADQQALTKFVIDVPIISNRILGPRLASEELSMSAGDGHSETSSSAIASGISGRKRAMRKLVTSQQLPGAKKPHRYQRKVKAKVGRDDAILNPNLEILIYDLPELTPTVSYALSPFSDPCLQRPISIMRSSTVHHSITSFLYSIKSGPGGTNGVTRVRFSDFIQEEETKLGKSRWVMMIKDGRVEWKERK